MNNGRDCEHGQLARSCDRCADAAEIAELRRKLQEQALLYLARDGECMALAEECGAMRKDAERYRWLRDEADFVRREDGSPQVCITDEWGEIISVDVSAYPRGAALDAAIDAELALHNV